MTRTRNGIWPRAWGLALLLMLVVAVADSPRAHAAPRHGGRPIAARSTVRAGAAKAKHEETKHKKAKGRKTHTSKPKPARGCTSLSSAGTTRCATTVASRLAGEVQSDGAVSRQVALETFAAEIAPLPGVSAPHGNVGYVGDGTGAVYQAIANWATLSRAQRAAIEKTIARLVAPARRRARGSSARTADLPGAEQTTALVQQYANRYQAIFGRLNEEISVTRAAILSDPGLDAGTFPLAQNWLPLPGAVPRRCVIVINTVGPLAGAITDNTEQVLAHEVFHCFQAQFAGTIGNFSAALAHSKWLMEGGANYAACTLVPSPDDFVGPWVDNAYATYTTPLFERAYDGVGFFDHLGIALNRTPTQTLGLMPAMVHAAGGPNAQQANAAAYAAAVGSGDESTVLGTWASSLFHDSTFAGFYEDDPCALAPPPDAGAKPQTLTLSTATQTVSTGPLANGIYDLQQGSGGNAVDILNVTVKHGYVRIAGGVNSVDDLLGAGTALGTTRSYCLLANGCGCLQGSSASSASTGQLTIAGAPPPHLAITGDTGGGMATVTGQDCPAEITHATFVVNGAQYNASADDQSWTANASWSIAWDQNGLNPNGTPTGPLMLPTTTLDSSCLASGACPTWVASPAAYGSGSYTYTESFSGSPQQCAGSLVLGTPADLYDADILVVGSSSNGNARSWTLLIDADASNAGWLPTAGCTEPPFSDTSDEYYDSNGGHLFQGVVTLTAGSNPTGATQSFTVTPNHASGASSGGLTESFGGMVTLTGTW